MSISIAIAGKGGTGKTILSTLFIRLLAKECGLKVLAIDADSASSLPYTLGVDVRQTISQMRNELATYRQAQARLKEKPMSEFMKEILTRADGFDLMAMGRPEEPGCFCAVNELLKYGIDTLSEEYDVVVIDGEAGPEQLNRRVMTHINFLLVTADMSFRSFQTAQSILDVAEKSEGGISVDHAGIVLNRMRSEEEKRAFLNGIEVFGVIPGDAALNEYDRIGKSLFALPENAIVVQAVREIQEKVFNML